MSTSSSPPGSGVSRSPPHMATLVVLAGSSAMAMSVFLPVLPWIAEDMNVSDATAQYVLTLFLVTTAFAQLIIGPMSDRFGRRPVLLTSVTVFLAASLVCYFSTTIEWLLTGRVLQASSAASIVLGRAIIRDLYDRSKAASMMGYVTMAMAALPMITPTIGGFIGEWFGWRSTFLLLLAVGVLNFLLIYIDLGETHPAKKTTIGMQIQNYFELMKTPQVWGYFLTGALSAGPYFSFLGGAPFVGQKILGLTPSVLGMYMGSVAIGYILGNYLSGRYSERIGVEPMMLGGALFATLGAACAIVLMVSFEPHAFFLFGPMAIVGLGNGMTLPNANAGAVSVRPDLAGAASGMSGFIQIGCGAGLAIASGHLISVENLAMPLYALMFGSSLAGTFFAIMMYRTTPAY